MSSTTKYLSLLILGLNIATARADLVVNGSFENPSVTAGTYTNFGAGANIGGWTVVGVDSALVNSAVQRGITFQAQNGSNWIDLAGENSNSRNSGVTQTLSTTMGALYELKFHVGSATDNMFFFQSTVDLSINGGTRVSFTNPSAPANMLDWKLFMVPFTATSTTTNLTFFNGSAQNNFLSGLDNVSITAVPEPSSLLLIVVGLTAGVVARHRRNNAEQTIGHEALDQPF